MVLFTLAGGLGAAWLKQGPSEVSVDAAVEEFRRSRSETAPPDGAAAQGDPRGADPGSVDSGSGAGDPDPPEATSGATTAGPGGGGQSASDLRPPRTPAEGVYPFRTEGWERLAALGGSRHDYPPETTVTIRHRSCGATERWQPLEERWDETELCPVGEGVEVRSFRKFNRFFQQSQTQEYRCPAGNKVWDRPAPPGASWRWRCESSDSIVDSTITVVGHENFRVEGRDVPAVRVRYVSTLSGATRGTQVQERLLERMDGQVLMVRSDVDVEFDGPFGTTRYEEHYLIEALTLRPRT